MNHIPCGHWHKKIIVEAAVETANGNIYYYTTNGLNHGIAKFDYDTQVAFLPLPTLYNQGGAGTKAAVSSTGISYWPINEDGNRKIVVVNLVSMAYVSEITVTDRPQQVILDESTNLLYYLAYKGTAKLKIWKIDLATNLETASVESSAEQSQNADLSSFSRSGDYFYVTCIFSLHKFQISTFSYIGNTAASLYESFTVADAPSNKLFTMGKSITTSRIKRYNLTSFAFEQEHTTSAPTWGSDIKYDSGYAYGISWGNPSYVHKWKADGSTFEELVISIDGVEAAGGGCGVVDTDRKVLYVAMVTASSAAYRIVMVDMSSFSIIKRIPCVDNTEALSYANIGLYYKA